MKGQINLSSVILTRWHVTLYPIAREGLYSEPNLAFSSNEALGRFRFGLEEHDSMAGSGTRALVTGDGPMTWGFVRQESISNSIKHLSARFALPEVGRAYATLF